MLDPITSELFIAALTALAGGGGAFVGLKTSLNGTKQRVEKIEDTTNRIWDKVNDTNSRLGILEVRHDFAAAEVEALRVTCKEKHHG
jgi:hypothetical protein